MKHIKRKVKNGLFVTAIALVTVYGQISVAQQTTSSSTAKNANATSEIIMTKEVQAALTPEQALQKLKEGNIRFAENNLIKRNYAEELKQTAKGQFPHSVILSCLDSRTSSELIFDQGLGSIFNARVAGNFENTDILGSMEFACKAAGAKLILVIGHSNCGAVKGACDNVQLGNLTNVIEQIKPATERVKNLEGERNSKNHDYVEAVAKENVLLTINDIRKRSPILAEMESKEEIMIVGAMYDLETGKVNFMQD
ncbi:MAG: carbonic anhydrase [Chitinophagales bacterium]|nr:carbonic anhydrase [Chitinophagales bacterium]